ncbi:protein moonraker isoform X2 [Phyllopteryx taeniolatus]|uniref:protein moonraker isoform X2 n=1 Tax=Phyllopteryx taeniolatus TaxID=161469 RepID=UPI002AD49880|nr:protein moonraker isoform X2 [Phyllopteryx taeniolatus]
MISFGQQTSGKEWVVLASNRNTHNSGYLTTGTSQTKLLFNEAVPASFRNRATAVGPPAAIVIEKLLPLPPGERRKEADGSVKSSVSFSSLSEEKLQAAVDLVKRDLRRSRFQAMCRSSADPSEDASVLDICNMILPQMTAELSLKERLTRPGSKHPAPRKRPVASKQIGRLPTSSRPAASVDQQHLLRREVCKRQNELESLKKGLNPEVNQLGARQPQDTAKKPPIACRLHNPRPPLTRHTIHKTTDKPDQQCLLKQEIFKLQNEGLEHSDSAIVQGRTSNSSEASAAKKSADNVSKTPPIASKLSWTKDPIPKPQGTVAQRNLLGHEMYKLDAEVESYLRQVEKLSDRVTSCVNNEHNEDDQLEPGERKKLEVRWQKQSERSARSIYCLQQQVKEIQQYIEKLHNQDMWDNKKILDYAISKHKTLQAMQDRACHQQRKQSTRAPKGSGGARRLPKGTNPLRSSHARRMAMQKRQGPDRLGNLQRVPQQHKRNSPGKKEHQATNVKGNLGEQDAHFKEPTVSSRLRVNQLPHRESTVPWIPASSHSLSPPRSCHKTTSEPRCLSSPAKPSSSLSPPKVSVGFSNDAHLNSEKMRQAQNEALRGAWLDKTTAQRLEDLNQLTREEAEHVQRLRAEVVSPTQWAERAEQQARDKIRPLLDEAKHLGESWSRSILSLRNKLSGQAAMRVPERAEQAGEALPEDLLEEAAQRVLQAPTLEGMLERMEEIQRDQEQVRRRVASIAYSDGLQWDQLADSRVQVPGSGPSSPQPIRLTRPVLRQAPAADIVLEEPVETGVLSESSLMEEASREVGPPIFPGPKESGAARMVLSVSGGMLRSIRHYREDYEAYLRHAAHEGGSADVNFWSIADSLAEELLWDAAADVAAEFQDVMEECAEAVFTAEFLQLIHSPRVTSSSSSLVNQ